MSHADIAVIGGGLSGITFAHFAAKSGKSVIVFEKRSSPGGCLQTIRPYTGSAFFMELGAHTIYSSYGTILEMIYSAGLTKSIIPHLKPGYYMYENGRMSSVFSHFNFLGGLGAVLRFPFCRKAGMTVREYYTKVFGVKNYTNLIHPMTSAVICQDSSDVAADLLLKSRKKDKSYPRAFSLPGGLLSLLEKVVEGNGITLHTQTPVVSIEQKDGKFTVNTDGAVFTADKIALAADARSAATLLDGWRNPPEGIPELAALLKELPMKKTVAFGLSALSENIKVPLFGYIIAKNCPFRAAVSRDVVKDDLYRGVTFHFKPETNVSEYTDIACNVLKTGREHLLNTEVSEFMLPELRITHEKWRNKVEKSARVKNFYLLGNFFNGLSLEDCAIRAKSEAERAAGE